MIFIVMKFILLCTLYFSDTKPQQVEIADSVQTENSEENKENNYCDGEFIDSAMLALKNSVTLVLGHALGKKVCA